MSVETARAAEQFEKLSTHYRQETEHLRAVLVHIMLDIEEWRDDSASPWAGSVLDVIDARVRAELHCDRLVETATESEGTPE